MNRYCVVLFVSLFVISSVNAIVSRTNVTVSGASSGAAMATQMHIAFSEAISGVGVFAGPPYDCAGGLLTAAECLSGPVTSISIPDIVKRIAKYESEGLIDRTSNMIRDPVYIFSGKYDPIVPQPIARLNDQLYAVYNTSIKTNYDLPSTHGYPTYNFGEPCPILNVKYFINKCNFSIAYDALNFLYGGDLIQPTWTSATPLVGQMILFNQEAFMNPPPALVQRKVDATVTQWLATYLALYDPADWGWQTSGLSNWTIPKTTTPNDEQQSQLTAASFDFDVKGFVYFPLACAKTKKCPIHVAIHGCRQGKYYVGDVFVRKASFLEVAELNNIIVLFPQVVPSIIDPINPQGCWDWWGYTSKQFATKIGPQMIGVKKMIDTVQMLTDVIGTSA